MHVCVVSVEVQGFCWQANPVGQVAQLAPGLAIYSVVAHAVVVVAPSVHD